MAVIRININYKKNRAIIKEGKAANVFMVKNVSS